MGVDYVKEECKSIFTALAASIIVGGLASLPRVLLAPSSLSQVIDCASVGQRQRAEDDQSTDSTFPFTTQIQGGKKAVDVRESCAQARIFWSNDIRSQIPGPGGWQAFFDFLLVVVGFLQWRINRRMHSNDVLTNRAFVFLSGFDATPQKTHNGIRGWEFTLFWTNSGRTQTRDLVIHTRSQYFPAGAVPALSHAIDPEVSTGMIGPAGVLKRPTVCFHLIDVVKAKGSEGSMFVWAEARYRDTYTSERRRTQTCFEITPMTDPERPDCAFRLRHIGSHNCADKECVDEDDWYPASGA